MIAWCWNWAIAYHAGAGSFSFDDRARSISVLTEGANGSLCVGQSAKRDEGSIGLCFQLWADWPLGSNPNGAAGSGAFIHGRPNSP